MTVLIDAFWCESLVCSPEAGAEWELGGYRAESADEALSWLLEQAGSLAGALESHDHAEGDGISTSGQVAHLFRKWARDTGFHEVQLAELESGGRISANARCRDRVVGRDPVELLYTLSARPITYPLGRVRGVAGALPGGARSRARGERSGVAFLGTWAGVP